MNMATVRLADAKRIEKGHHCRFRVELEALSQETDETQKRLDQARGEIVRLKAALVRIKLVAQTCQLTRNKEAEDDARGIEKLCANALMEAKK